MTPLQPFGHYFRDMAGNQHFHTGATPPSFAHSEITPLYAHPSRGVVDEAFIAKLGEEAYRVHSATRVGPYPNDSHAPKWQAVVRMVIAALEAQAAALPAVPDVPKGWTPDVSNGGQVSVGDASHTPGRKLWHTDPHGRFWTGYTGTRTAQQLMAECESTIRDLRALLAATPAHDQPEGSDNE